ncbi:MAG: transcription elongation factor GreA [Candidatus Latescibacterota bacterium]|nr:MAG: transcription elongation factor GreA [Candidatus Latescibacteria bacterium 4484_107]RKY66818.1 MAG: transcription elongation factor GreA [Candidatus Latescibacterota bacterium]
MEELKHLKTVERPKIIERISTARDFGDLKENAEYAAAKERQSMLENKIMELEDKLARAVVLDDKDIRTDKAYFGATVTLKDLETEETLEYTLVSTAEADFDQGKISVESPVGKGLLGKAVGEIAEIAIPAGMVRYEILNISVE